jgi:hypothetical protein
MNFYNQYDLFIAGKINDFTTFDLIEQIEKKYQVDSVQLLDNTRIWNLLRVFIYINLPQISKGTKESLLVSKNRVKSILSLIKESIRPLNLHGLKNNICGFSSTESRKLINGQYYDIYLDPLYEIIGDTFIIFEWPEISGYRRKYKEHLYSPHYVPMYIPITTKTFWDLLFYKIFKRTTFFLKDEHILHNIINYLSKKTGIQKEILEHEIHEFIAVFYYIKSFLYQLLREISPKAVVIRCGYGRFAMALSQACQELNISSIELQHGLITSYHPAYVKTTSSKNLDCIPKYLLTQGDIFTKIVQQGKIFKESNIITIGYPYLEIKQKEIEGGGVQHKDNLRSPPATILFTSQWILAQKSKAFISEVAQQFIESKMNVRIIFKPHPYDTTDYSSLAKFDNITLADKYEYPLY